MEKEVLEIFAVVKRAGDAAAADGGSPEVTRCLDALRQLRKMPLTTKELVATKRNPLQRRKPAKPAAKVPYMRDTIAGMSRLLRSSTWEHAGRELRGLPIRWDPYTVNQVLKTHPPMEMRRMGCDPTVVSYTAFMKVLLDHGRPREAAVVYREMLEAGLTPTCHTYTVLIEYLAGSGKFDAAFGIWNKMQEAGVQPDKATCNILIQKCSKFQETTTMFQVLNYMKDHSFVLRLPIFLEALETLRNCGESDNFLREVNPHFSSVGMEQEISCSGHAAYDFSACIDHGIIFNLLARQNFVAIDHMLKEMMSQNIKLETELIAAIMQASARNGRLTTASLAFQYGAKLGQKHERHVYLSLIGPIIRLNCFQEVLKIIDEMIKLGHSLGTYLVALLILKFGCMQMPAHAAKLFYSSPADQNTVTYTTLIHAYLQSAEIDKGLQVYANMRKGGIRVSSGTYEVLIVALGEGGRNREAEFFKKERKKLQFSECSQAGISMEESLCDCFFNGG